MSFASVPTISSDTPIQISFDTINTAGNTTIVPAQGIGIRIKVLALAVTADAPNKIKFKSNTTDISARFPLGADSVMILPISDVGWMFTNTNQALNINLTAASQVGCHIVWTQSIQF